MNDNYWYHQILSFCQWIIIVTFLRNILQVDYERGVSTENSCTCAAGRIFVPIYVAMYHPTQFWNSKEKEKFWTIARNWLSIKRMIVYNIKLHNKNAGNHIESSLWHQTNLAFLFSFISNINNLLFLHIQLRWFF